MPTLRARYFDPIAIQGPIATNQLIGLNAAQNGIKAPPALAALLNAGYVGAAMRKYVRATWLMQDGKEAYNPALPMTEVSGRRPLSTLSTRL